MSYSSAETRAKARNVFRLFVFEIKNTTRSDLSKISGEEKHGQRRNLLVGIRITYIYA